MPDLGENQHDAYVVCYDLIGAGSTDYDKADNILKNEFGCDVQEVSTVWIINTAANRRELFNQIVCAFRNGRLRAKEVILFVERVAGKGLIERAELDSHDTQYPAGT